MRAAQLRIPQESAPDMSVGFLEMTPVPTENRETWSISIRKVLVRAAAVATAGQFAQRPPSTKSPAGGKYVGAETEARTASAIRTSLS